LYWHGFATYRNYHNWTINACPINPNTTVCLAILNDTINQVGVIDQPLLKDFLGNHKSVQDDNLPSLDPDDIYFSYCEGNGTLSFVKSNPEDCESVDYDLNDYLNRADVQAALHVNPTNWSLCDMNLNYTIGWESMVPIYRSFVKRNPNLHILIYSGDVDILTVPFAMTQPCIWELRDVNNLVSAWQPWFVNRATAGYVEYYDHFTYATLKGAGHEAPEFQPLSAFQMINRWILHQNLTMTENTQQTGRRARPIRQSDVLRMRRNKF